ARAARSAGRRAAGDGLAGIGRRRRRGGPGGVARYHKERLLAFVREECDALADADGIDRRNAARLSRQWLVLIDGAIGVALVSGDASASRDARSAGEVLLAAFEARAD
ncbi:hypothetical protein PPH41_14500, partial [Burkholderia gladioli]|nr:hypothetical protein [Burkholderia gladioli]